MAIKEDVIDIEVLSDGTVKVTTPKISSANHMSADQLLGEVARTMGGETKITKRSAHTHTHAHGVEHEGHKH